MMMRQKFFIFKSTRIQKQQYILIWSENKPNEMEWNKEKKKLNLFNGLWLGVAVQHESHMQTLITGINIQCL